MAEVVVELMKSVMDDAGNPYGVLACGDPTADGTWQGWLEFVTARGRSRLRSPRETTQPNRDAVIYWATGLTPVFIEGSFDRALAAERAATTRPRMAAATPPVRESSAAVRAHASDTPAPPRVQAVLDPFSVYAKGEALLRKQLRALSAWHLVNIIIAYDLSDQSEAALHALPGTVLIDLIVDAVAAQSARAPR